MDPECVKAVEGAARLLADLGHEVVEASPPFPRDVLVRAYLVVLAASVAGDVALAARATGGRVRLGDLEPETAALVNAGRVLEARDLVLAEHDIHLAARGIAKFFEAHDLLVTSTMARPPLPLGSMALRPHERAGIRALSHVRSRRAVELLLSQIPQRSFDATGNTMLFNETGQPAISVPLHWTPDGLPVGIQLAARMGDEATLLRVAAQLEEATRWTERTPPGI